MNTDHCSGHGKTSEHIISRRDQTLGIVASALVLETTLRIEFLSVLRCCRKIVLGTIEGNDRHAMPKIGGISRPELVGQLHRILKDVLKDRPWNLLARFCEGATVDGFIFRPKSATLGAPEELTGLDVHSFALATGNKGEDKSDQLGKGKLTSASEIFDGLLDLRSHIFWNEIEKIGESIGKLA